jgi:hypothetical protein
MENICCFFAVISYAEVEFRAIVQRDRADHDVARSYREATVSDAAHVHSPMLEY